MIKSREQRDPASCLNRAKEGEMIFVLLARDEDAPATIRYWVKKRIRRGKNKKDDPEIVSALACAMEMEEQRARSRKA
jgi:hypothetical protein